MNIIEKIGEKNLVGRGGACFPVAFKWKTVRDTKATDKYVVCNAAEGEPGVFKDEHILENYPDAVVDGIKLAIDTLKVKKAYIYINKEYYDQFQETLKRKFRNHSIEFFIKPKDSGYIGGEETAILNAIEGERVEPRIRPPFPPASGLWGKPTLVHNVETFFDISLLAAGEFKGKRFYGINGEVEYPGVYHLSSGLSIEKILEKTGNYPSFNFFVQVGGDAAGEVLNKEQLKKKVNKAGAITLYHAKDHDPKKILQGWVDFFLQESCGKCTICREGTYRLKETLNSSKPDWSLFHELVRNLSTTSFCGLGCATATPLRSYLKNVVAEGYSAKQKLSSKDVAQICECFK